MDTLLLTMLLGLVPHSTVLDDSADVVEVNRYYDEHGDLVFDQVIFWEWRVDESAYRVFAWRLLKSPHQAPQRDYYRGGYVSVWQDQHGLRRVRSPSNRKTWTQYDPELLDREIVPQDQRRGLARR